jgi:hypothetical protein
VQFLSEQFVHKQRVAAEHTITAMDLHLLTPCATAITAAFILLLLLQARLLQVCSQFT